MTHSEFKSLANQAGADIVFDTAKVAVFKCQQTGLVVTVEYGDPLKTPDLQVVTALEDAGRVTSKRIPRVQA